MRISVALCTYNGERYLAEQLDSLVRQERPPDELIVCDDCSTDATPRLLGEFARTAPFPVRWSINERNLGSTLNFSEAVRRCEGDVIFLCDQDDVWCPEKMARMTAVFEKDRDVVLVASNAGLIDAAGCDLKKDLWSALAFPEEIRSAFSARPAKVLLEGNRVTGAASAFHRSVLRCVLPIPARWIHDAWIAFLASLIGKVCLIADPLISYRIHPHQQIGVQFPDKKSTRENLEKWHADFTHVEERCDALAPADKERIDASLLQEIKDRLRHYRARLTILDSPFHRRLPLVLRELFGSHYAKFGVGAFGSLSAAADLVKRGNDDR